MRKWLLLLLLAIVPAIAQAQVTTVTGVVVDANSNAYFPGTISASIVLNSGQPIPAGVPASGSIGPFATTSGGNFSVVVASPFTWIFTICGTPKSIGPLGNPTPTQVCFSTAPVAISGASQVITSSLPTIPILGPGGGSGGITPVGALPGNGNACVANTQYQLTVASPGFPTGFYIGNTGGTCSFVGPAQSSPYTLANFMGVAPDNCGNATCTVPVYPPIRYLRFCYDGQTSGQPTATFNSGYTFTLTNSALTSNVATYTFANSAGGAAAINVGMNVTVTGSNNANGALNVTNGVVLSTTGTTSITVAFTHANVASAADTGSITTLGAVGCANFRCPGGVYPCSTSGVPDSDVGDTIEIVGDVGGNRNFPGGTTGLTTTIASIQSQTQCTLARQATTNLSNTKFWFGTLADTPVQNWVTTINNGEPSLTTPGLLSHQGILLGLYLVSQPVRLVNPLSVTGVPGVLSNGYGLAEPFSVNNAQESLQILGNGQYRSGFIGGANFNWSLPNTSVNNGLCYFTGWNGPSWQNFACAQADTAIVYNTTANTGNIALFMDDTNAHVFHNGITIENAHNTTSSLLNHQILTWFQSRYYNTAIYGGDCGQVIGLSGSGNDDDILLSGFIIGGGGPFIGTGCSAVDIEAANNFTYENSFLGPSAANGGANLRIGPGVSMSANDEMRFVNIRFTNCATNQECVAVNGAAVNPRLSFTNSTFQSAGSATGFPLLNQNASADIHIIGGTISCTASCAAAGISNVTGGLIHIVGTRINGTVGLNGTGASTIFQTVDTATGWSGPGTLQSTQHISNQGTACTNAELVLSAGWQSTGSATVTLVAGTGQTCSWTITTGTTTAANPTITDNLTNALPTATTVCEMNIHGGTHTAAANDAFTNTTLSATAPIFTANFTPTAGGTTYLITRRCGP